MTQERGLDAEWLDMRESWDAIKHRVNWAKGEMFMAPPFAGQSFAFTRKIETDGSYKILCNGRRVVEQGEISTPQHIEKPKT